MISDNVPILNVTSLNTESKLTSLSKKLSFMRYFMYVLIPYLFSNFFIDFMHESIPSTSIEYYMIVSMFLLSVTFLWQSLLNKFLWNYSRNIIIVISVFLSIITYMSCAYYQIINFDFQLMGYSIGINISLLIGSLLLRFDTLQYQDIKLNNLKYKIFALEHINIFITKTGLIKVHYISFAKINLKSVPQESIYLLSSLSKEFQVTVNENNKNVCLIYNKSVDGYIFNQKKIKKELVEDFLMFFSSLQKIIGNRVL